MLDINKQKLSFLPLFLLLTISQQANAVVTDGTLVYDPAECTNSGLTATLVGTGIIVTGGFEPLGPPSGQSIYRCSTATTQGTEEQVVQANRQITRDTHWIVSDHLMKEVFRAFTTAFFTDNANKAAASSDGNNYTPNAFWGVTSFSEITKDNDSNQPHFDTDIYHFVGGFDKRYGDLFFGSALTYAYAEYEVASGNDSSSHTVGVTPYVAYKLNDFLFASALAGYNYTNTNFSSSGNTETDTHEYVTEANLNAYKVIDSFIFKGRGGVRYKHTNSSAIQSVFGRDNDFDELTWIGDVEFGYQVNDDIRIYTGALYEYVDVETSAASALINDGIVFMRYGAEYTINDSLIVGAKLQHDLNDEDNDYLTGSINFRLSM